MRVDIDLNTDNEFGWLACNWCLLLGADEWGKCCALNYTADMSDMNRGWLNLKTGAIVAEEVAGTIRIIIRPQECIGKHGK